MNPAGGPPDPPATRTWVFDVDGCVRPLPTSMKSGQMVFLPLVAANRG
jgi:hypothetical protein